MALKVHKTLMNPNKLRTLVRSKKQGFFDFEFEKITIMSSHIKFRVIFLRVIK